MYENANLREMTIVFLIDLLKSQSSINIFHREILLEPLCMYRGSIVKKRTCVHKVTHSRQILWMNLVLNGQKG